MYHLQKYRTKNDRHECPNCHDRHSFTWYVDDDGQPIDPTCGICNHINRCGYHYPPRKYFADHPTDRKQMGDRPKPKTTTPPPIPKPLCTLPFDYVRKSRSYNSAFVRFLHGLFGADIVHYLMALYNIGATRKGDVIFWQIDKAGRVRSGKIMRYKADGHRDHGYNDWVHYVLKRRNELSDDWGLTQCLFGEHLLSLKWNEGKPVAIVESEKTALIGAAVCPQYVWLATCGANTNLHEKLKALAGRKVELFPDTHPEGKFYKLWKEEATKMTAYCKASVFDLLEREATSEQKEKGIDIADWLIDEIKAGERQTILTNEMQATIMREQSPIVNALIEGLNLKPFP